MRVTLARRRAVLRRSASEAFESSVEMLGDPGPQKGRLRREWARAGRSRKGL